MATNDNRCPMRMIVGLGNPGREYLDTRHNAGFMAVDQYARDLGLGFNDEKRWHTKISRDGERYLLKPQTFMNESGSAVGKVAAFYKIEPAQILVLYDDIDLPLGRLRIRGGGSAGGHNGMRSIISALSGSQFPRLRIGIGRPETDGRTAIDHVLGAFSMDEKDQLDVVLDQVIAATKTIVTKGISNAMNSYNVG